MKALAEAISVCLECRSNNIIHDLESGEVICGGCGLVIADSTIDEGPEWRAFTQSESEAKTRVGLPPMFSIHDKGLSTTLSPVGRDAYGRRIPQERRLQMYRLWRWHTRSRVSASLDRNLAQAMLELDRLTDTLHIPLNVKEETAIIYRRALKEGVVRGRRISVMAAASLYAACRITETPRTLGEVARHSPTDRKELSRSYRILIRELNLHMPVQKAQLNIPKIASRVEVGGEIQRKAIEILVEADRLKITVGKDPMGLAAAALYLACVMNGENRTQKMLAEAAGVTEVTIRNRYTELKRVLDM